LSTWFRGRDTNALLEPGDTEQQWKGEAAASFVCAGITSSRALPTSSVGYWSPSIILVHYKRLRSDVFLRGRYFCPKCLRQQSKSQRGFVHSECRAFRSSPEQLRHAYIAATAWMWAPHLFVIGGSLERHSIAGGCAVMLEE